MSLLPSPLDKKNYRMLCEKYFASKASNGKLGQTFRMLCNITHGAPADAIEKRFKIDGISGCKFQFNATFDCTTCNGYRHYIGIGFSGNLACNGCWKNTARFSFSVLNSGVEVQADFDLEIEKSDKTITSIFKENKKLAHSEEIRRSFELKNHRKWFYSIVQPITLVLKIKNIKTTLPEQPKCPTLNAKLSEMFYETCMNTAAPRDPLADVTLHVEGRKIYGHKVILSLGSKYFKKMFESNMKEAKKNVVYLKEIDFTNFQYLMEFLYRDTIDESKITLDLLVLADRFEVMRLMEICIERLSKTINSENVTKIFEDSYLHGITQLTHDCVIYMVSKWKSLLKDEKVVQLVKKYSELHFTISALISENNADCS